MYTLVQTHTPAHVHALSRHPRAPFTLTHTTQMPAHTDMFCICISSPLHQTRGPMHTQNHTHSDTKFTHIHTQRHPHNTFTRTHKNSAHIFIHTCTNFIASTHTHTCSSTHTHSYTHTHKYTHTHINTCSFIPTHISCSGQPRFPISNLCHLDLNHVSNMLPKDLTARHPRTPPTPFRHTEDLPGHSY